MNEYNYAVTITNCGLEAQKTAAYVSDILFDMERRRFKDKICDSMKLASERICSAKIIGQKLSGGKLMLTKAVDNLRIAEDGLDEITEDLSDALTELYKYSAMNDSLASLLEKCAEELSDAVNYLNTLDTDKDTETDLLKKRKLRDLVASLTVVSSCTQTIKTNSAQCASLVMSLDSLNNAVIPLWKNQLSRAASKKDIRDIESCITTGKGIIKSISDMVSSFIGGGDVKK